MCGIVGFVGKQQAAPILLDGLSKLEYRGYDSAGIAVRDNKQEVKVVKAKGRLKGLMEKTDNGRALKGDCGIGHTRWATHGEPSEVNAHPHVSDDGNVVGVHNGIIENYQELKAKLLKKGYSFYSSTDTEVILMANAFGFEQTDRFFTRKTYSIITVAALLFYSAAKSYSFFTGANHLESGIPKGIPGVIVSGGLILPLNICVGMVVACTMYGFYSLFRKGEIG